MRITNMRLARDYILRGYIMVGSILYDSSGRYEVIDLNPEIFYGGDPYWVVILKKLGDDSNPTIYDENLLDMVGYTIDKEVLDVLLQRRIEEQKRDEE